MSADEPTLVLVAHPGDETLAFSGVCAGADVACVFDERRGRQSDGDSLFTRACETLGAERALSLGLNDADVPRLSADLLAGLLDGKSPYRRVYTHSPYDAHSRHRELALAASELFGGVYVQALGGCATDVYTLERPAFIKKLYIINGIYTPRMLCLDFHDDSFLNALSSVEAFARASVSEVARAITLTQSEFIASVPDPWAFETSAYENERITRTCEMLSTLDLNNPHSLILELGACEGLLTQRLRRYFPQARIRAVESNPIFANRLRERVGGDALTEIVEASAVEAPVAADVIVAAEVLYYLPSDWAWLLDRVEANYLLTSQFTSFDEGVAVHLTRAGWRNILTTEFPPRVEPIGGSDGLFLTRRGDTKIRLWTAPRSSPFRLRDI